MDTLVPTNGAHVMTTAVEGHTARGDEDVYFYVSSVGPEYFQAAGTRLLRGRGFIADDFTSAQGVAVISETAARRYWAGRDALGGRIETGDKQWLQVVGIVEDTTVHGLDDEPAPYLYQPFQHLGPRDPVDSAHLLVRTSGDAESILGSLDAQLRSLDADAPVYAVSTFAWRVRQLVMPQRMAVTLFGVFSALALTLAAIGIYGVASYVTALRTREIGIRIALGADRAGIRTLMLRQGSSPVIAGMIGGLADLSPSGAGSPRRFFEASLLTTR